MSKNGSRATKSREHNDPALTLIADMPADMDFRCNGPSADAQAFGCHHPNIATKKQETKSVIAPSHVPLSRMRPRHGRRTRDGCPLAAAPHLGGTGPTDEILTRQRVFRM